VTANAGYKILSIEGCNGGIGSRPLWGQPYKETTFTVDEVKSNCTIAAVFEPSVAFSVNIEDADFAGCVDFNAVSLGAKTAADLTELNCGGYRIRSLEGINKFIHLKKLELSYMSLGSLDISGLSELTDISFSYMSIMSSPDLSSNVNLERLSVTHCGIFNPVIDKNKKLISLSYNYFDVESINLSGLSDLQSLVVEASSKLKYLTFSELNTSLKTISLNGGELSNIDLGFLSSLESLDVSYIDFESLKFPSNGSKLKTLNISSNKVISAIDISSLTELTDLSLSYSPITELNVAANTKLVSLDAVHNKIKTVTGVGAIADKTAKIDFTYNLLDVDSINYLGDLKTNKGYVNLSY
jgi:hypothetical protein